MSFRSECTGYVVKDEYENKNSDRLLVTFCYENMWVAKRTFYPRFLVDFCIKDNVIKITDNPIH